MIDFYELNRERDEKIFFCDEYDAICPSHFHKKVEIMYVTEGIKTIYIDGVETIIEKDQLFIADRYVPHGYIESSYSKQIVFVIPNYLLINYFDYMNDKQLNGYVIKDKDYCYKIKKYITIIKDHNNVNPLIYTASVDMLLGGIIEKLGTKHRDAFSKYEFIEKVLAYIEENFQNEITLESIASHFGYSKYYFSRMFNMSFGTNINEYISSIRVNRVLDKIRRENCSVSEAVYECGFSSIPTFYRVLKKKYKYDNIKDLIKKMR